MRIGIDITDLSTGILGVGIVLKKMVEYFEKNNSEDDFFLYQNDDLNYANATKFYKRIAHLKLYDFFSEQLYFTGRSFLDSLDIFHAPIHMPPLIKPAKTKTVFTVHDLHIEMNPSHYYPPKMRSYFMKNREEAILNSDAIVVHSEFVKENILDWFNVDEKKINIIPVGVKEEFLNDCDESKLIDVRTRHNLPNKYVLYVGSIEPWKRVPFLIESFLEYKQQSNDDAHLVIVGRNGWDRAGVAFVENAAKESKCIHQLGFVLPEDLPAVYQMATAFVSASIAEGFGSIFLEAMASGVPTIAVNSTAIPEIVGDAGLLFEVNSKNDFIDKINSVLQNDSLRMNLIDKANKRIKMFYWENYGKSLQNLYTRL